MRWIENRHGCRSVLALFVMFVALTASIVLSPPASAATLPKTCSKPQSNLQICTWFTYRDDHVDKRFTWVAFIAHATFNNITGATNKNIIKIELQQESKLDPVLGWHAVANNLPQSPAGAGNLTAYTPQYYCSGNRYERAVVSYKYFLGKPTNEWINGSIATPLTNFTPASESAGCPAP